MIEKDTMEIKDLKVGDWIKIGGDWREITPYLLEKIKNLMPRYKRILIDSVSLSEQRLV